LWATKVSADHATGHEKRAGKIRIKNMREQIARLEMLPLFV
jgi:hypothetical protein